MISVENLTGLTGGVALVVYLFLVRQPHFIV